MSQPEILDRHRMAIVPLCCDRPDCGAGFCQFESCSCACHRYPLTLDLGSGPSLWQLFRIGLRGVGALVVWVLAGLAVAWFFVVLAVASVLLGIAYTFWCWLGGRD
jgi:hypothetical protein